MPERGPLVRVAKEINRVLDYVDSMKIARGKAYRVRHTAHGQLIDFTDSGADELDPGTLQRFYLSETANDYLQCYKADEDGQPILGSGVFNVAKPMSLRISKYNGVTRTAFGGSWIFSYSDGNNRRLTVDGGSRYFDEVLWPPYEEGEHEIYAMKAIGKCEVEVDGSNLEWVDVNVHGRAFRPKMTLVSTCSIENGLEVVKYFYVSGGPIQS